MQVEISNRQSAVRVTAPQVRSLLRRGLKLEGKDAQLSVALVGDREIAELNRRFLRRRRVTDVLAFPYESDGQTVSGEIVVNAEQAVRQAQGRPHSAEDELMLYLVHGLLHLLGYDDRRAADRRRMREREQAILNAVGRHVEF
jgi:probable rRNA maturation factor